jgi:hypothetical protein
MTTRSLTAADNGHRIRLQSIETVDNTITVGDTNEVWPLGCVIEVVCLNDNAGIVFEPAAGVTLSSVDGYGLKIRNRQSMLIYYQGGATWETRVLTAPEAPGIHKSPNEVGYTFENGYALVLDSRHRDGVRWAPNGPQVTDDLQETMGAQNLWFSELRVLNTPMPAPPDPTVTDPVVQGTFIGAALFRLQAQIDAMSGSGSVNVTPDSHPTTAAPQNDEFEYGSSIDLTGARGSGAIPWTWVNDGGGGGVGAVSNGALNLKAVASGSDSLRAVTQPVSGSAWKYRTKISGVYNSGAGGTLQFGIGAYSSVNGRFLTTAIRYDGSNWLMCHSKWLSATSRYDDDSTSNIYSGVIESRSPRAPIYLEYELSGGNIYSRYSDTGHEGTFRNFYAIDPNNWLSAGLTDIGLFASTSNSGDLIVSFDWFRRES